MTANMSDHSEHQAAPREPVALPRYAALELEDGKVIIYDEEQHTAWIQADSAVPLAATV